MTLDELLDAWVSLTTPTTAGTLEATRLEDSDGIWAAVDHAGTRHLLIRVRDEETIHAIVTKGLTVDVVRHRIPGEHDADYIDLACVDDGATETFAAVAEEIAEGVGHVNLAGRSGIVNEILGRWKWFWGVSTDRLSERAALGLFGELWFLDQWVGLTSDTVDAWTGSEGSRHDFQWADRSVEVKTTTTRADGATLHRIQSLDQLADAETGALYLFSLRVVKDRLAANTLPTLVDRCSDQLRGLAATRDAFLRKVSARGYSPAHRRLHFESYRILDELIYEIAGDFPRVVVGSFPQGVPVGIGDVSYVLDMAACEPWLRASHPTQWDPHT